MILLIVVVITGVVALLNISNSAGFPWAECNIIENRRLYISDSIGLKRSKRGTNTHRYEFELVTNEMPIQQGQAVLAKLSRAVDDTLSFVHPRMSYSNGTVPISGVFASGLQSVGSTTVSLTSTDPWQLKAGDYIQLGTDTKVNQVVEDTALQAGIQNVELVLPLRNEAQDLSAVILNDVTWYLSSDGVIAVDTQANNNQDMQIVLSAVEQL